MTLQTPELLDSKTYGFEKLRYLFQSLDAQEGVIDPGDLKVTQNGTPNMTANVAAGRCFVQADTGTRNGLYHCVNDATVNVAFTASHATLPRIDMLVLTINDSSDLGSASDTPVLSVVPGTATSGATLDNRLGAATLPPNTILLADVLIPAAATTVTTANIRDRRLWSRGAYRRIARSANAAAGNNYTTSSLSSVEIDSTNLKPRIECSGVPLRITIRGRAGTTAGFILIGFFVDGAVTPEFGATSGGENAMGMAAAPAAADGVFFMTYDLLPTVGSHLIAPTWRVSTAGTGTIIASATAPVSLTIEEVVRQNADNT